MLLIHSGVGHRRVAVEHHRLDRGTPAPTGSAPAGRTRRSRRSSGRRGRTRAPAPTPALVALDQPGVRDDQPAAVEHVVADQAVDELLDRRRGTPSVSAASWASDSARPWVTCTLRPRSARSSLFSWLPDTQSASPARDHAHHQPQHAGGVRPAVDEVADEHRPAVGVVRADRAARARRGRSRSRARSSSASSSARQPWMSPMTSNGPVSSRRSLYSLVRVIVTSSISSAAQHVDGAEALALQALAGRAAAGRAAGG